MHEKIQCILIVICSVLCWISGWVYGWRFGASKNETTWWCKKCKSYHECVAESWVDSWHENKQKFREFTMFFEIMTNPLGDPFGYEIEQESKTEYE